MRNLATMVAATALLVPFFAPTVFGREKPLLPAFGKELVPDEQTQERKSKAAEREEEQNDRKDTKGPGPARHDGKVRIHLDGDEDGGDDGSDEDGDGGGDF